MLTILLIASCVLTIFFYKKKRSLENQGREVEFAYYFSRSSLDFFAPLTVVMLFYAGLLACISISSESISLQTLIWMDDSLSSLQTFFKKYISLSAERVFIIVVVLYLLSLLRVPFQKMYRPFSKLRRVGRIAYLLLAFLWSFTLFGTQLGPPTDNLKFRIKTIRGVYADVLQQTKEAIAEEAASKLYDKAHNSFPSDYQQSLKLPQEIGIQTQSLQQYYKSAQAEHGIKLPKFESPIGPLSPRKGPTSKLRTEIQVPEGAENSPITEPVSKSAPPKEAKVAEDATRKETLITKPASKALPPQGEAQVAERAAGNGPSVVKPVFESAPPPQVSYKQVKEAQSAITSYRQSIQSKAIVFLNTEEGKQLTLRAQKVVTSGLSKTLFAAWVEEYPILGPITSQLVSIFDKDLQTRLERVIPKDAEAIVQSPERVQQVVTDEASKLADQTPIKISPATLESANQTGKQAQQRVANIAAARAEIDSAIKRSFDSKVSSLISQLQNSNESVRNNAARTLSGMGDKLSQTKVNELIGIMRRGNKSWITSRTRQPGHHCTDYEYTSIRYYAATALSGMNSQHVSSDIAREARRCQSDSVTTKRVTDPGWI